MKSTLIHNSLKQEESGNYRTERYKQSKRAFCYRIKFACGIKVVNNRLPYNHFVVDMSAGPRQTNNVRI